MPGLETGTNATTLSSDLRRVPSRENPNFEEIYSTYQEIVRRICVRMLRDPSEAEDARQDVFIRVLLNLHTFRGESAFSSWLYRVTTNLVLMRFRKNKSTPMARAGCLEDNLLLPMELGGSHAGREWAARRSLGGAPLERYLAGNPGTRVVMQKYLARDLAPPIGVSSGKPAVWQTMEL